VHLEVDTVTNFRRRPLSIFILFPEYEGSSFLQNIVFQMTVIWLVIVVRISSLIS